MVEKEKVRSIQIFKDLPEEMIHMIAEVATEETVPAGTYLIKLGDFAENLYALLDGKVALEEYVDQKPVRVEDVQPKELFGISALVETDIKSCVSNARTLTESTILIWKAVELEKLFYKDFRLGYIVSRRIATTLRTRLVNKYAQLAN